jgi:hypothetical protein
MSESMADRAEELFDALVDYDIRTYDHLVTVLGWPHSRVSGALHYVRTHAGEVGFTVPHVSRGRGDDTRLYRAVLVGETDHDLNEDEQQSLLSGGRATASTIASMGENEAVSLRACAPYVDAKVGRKIVRLAKLLEGASAMADDVREALLAATNGERGGA